MDLDFSSGGKITEEKYGEVETEGGLQTVCICEEREYLSLSSWIRGGRRGR